MKNAALGLIFLLLTLSCGILPSVKLESEAAVENPDRAADDAEIFLNSESMGRISDLEKKPSGRYEIRLDNLVSRLSEIVKQREASGVFLEGTNEVAANVFLIPEGNLAVGAVGRLWSAIDMAGGDVMIPRLPLQESGSQPVKPNPLFLSVSTGTPFRDLGPDKYLPPIDREFRATHRATFEPAGAPDQLRLIRQEGALEISADERFFINGRSDSGVPVAQRPLEPSAFRSEAEKLRGKPGGVPIIVSDRARWSSLLRFLDTLAPGTPVRVIVRAAPVQD